LPAVKLLDRRGRQRLDRYELIGELASGGMATVFLGRILGVGGFQRFVAIKRLHPHLASDQEFVEMFLDEARLAASIHHPNVVPILEVGTSDKGYYLVMEYIEGDTFARLLARATSLKERIPAPIVIRIALDTLAGLHAAHELRDDGDNTLNLVHRDVSPQNILVGINGTARITDFGVARAATRLSSTRSGQLKGKLAYMAPEQARGGSLDRRADVFSLGTVLWEALADRRLFKGDGEAETLNRVLFEPIPQLRASAPDIPAMLEAATMKALEREAQSRYDTAAEFADELERAARACQAIASVREVAEYVQRLLGQEIAQQREAVRAWLAQGEPNRRDSGEFDLGVLPRGAAASSVSSAAITIPPQIGHQLEARQDELVEVTAPSRRRRRYVWGIVGGATALGAAMAVWSSTRRTHPAPTAAVDPSPAACVAATAAPVLPPAADAPALPSMDAPPSSAAQTGAASAPKASGSPAWGDGPRRPPGARPGVTRRSRPSSGPGSAVDDLPNNPYR
jgi:serine/threonine-protein kinase